VHGIFSDKLGLQPRHIAGRDGIRPCCGDPNLAWDVDYRIRSKLASSWIVVQSPAVGFERDHRGQIQAILVDDRAARIAGGHKHRPFVSEEARRVLADGAEALDHDPRTVQGHLDVLPRHIDCADKTKTRGADFVERDAADLARQPDGPADLVLDPAHCQLVHSHVRTRDILGKIANGRSEGPNEPFLLGQRHLGVAKNHRFAAAMRQAGRGVLEGHRPRQSERFLGTDIGRHPNATDRRPAGDVVDHDHRLETAEGRWMCTSSNGPSSSANETYPPSRPLQRADYRFIRRLML
jgi:hypothetical protein